jgi:hypothetical protein
MMIYPSTMVQLQELGVYFVFVVSGHFLCRFATTTPQTSKWLLAVGTYAAKVLAVVALHKAS